MSISAVMNISEVTIRPYQWLGKDGGWQVGKPLVDDCDCVVLRFYDKDDGERSIETLMQPSHAGKPTWVRAEDLQPYPVDPIEEPTTKGGAS